MASVLAKAQEKPEVLDWAHDHYIPNHHWIGTCQQGTSRDSAVVDSGGRVFGVRNLRRVLLQGPGHRGHRRW